MGGRGVLAVAGSRHLTITLRTVGTAADVVVSAMSDHAHSRSPRRLYRADSAATTQLAPTSVRANRWPLARAQPLEMLFVAGFAGVFLVNAIVAVIQPSDFTDLVERSVLGRSAAVMSGRWVAWVIAVHDFAIGALLLATIRFPRARPVVLAWAGAWLLAVTIVKLTALEALGG